MKKNNTVEADIKCESSQEKALAKPRVAERTTVNTAKLTTRNNGLDSVAPLAASSAEATGSICDLCTGNPILSVCCPTNRK